MLFALATPLALFLQRIVEYVFEKQGVVLQSLALLNQAQLVRSESLAEELFIELEFLLASPLLVLKLNFTSVALESLDRLFEFSLALSWHESAIIRGADHFAESFHLLNFFLLFLVHLDLAVET